MDADLEGIANEADEVSRALRSCGHGDLEGEAMEVERMSTGLRAVMAAQTAASDRDQFLQGQVSLLKLTSYAQPSGHNTSPNYNWGPTDTG